MTALDDSLAALLRGEGRWPAAAQADAVLARARLHGIGSLLHDVASREPPPPALREALRAHAVRYAALELARRAELLELLEALAARGLRPLLLKGTALAYSHYAQPALRERADTDLLIPAEQKDALFAALGERGFRRPDAAGGELASSEASFARPGSSLVLDVHWRLNNSPLLAPALPPRGIATGAVAVPALGRHARAPAPAQALLLAAVHRATHRLSPYYVGETAHRGDRLIWLHDLHLLGRSLTPSQWEEFSQSAVNGRVAGLCADALRCAARAFGGAAPPEVLARLDAAAARGEPSMAFLRGGRRRVLLAETLALRRWRERWQLLREHAFPPAGYMLRKYSTHRRWLLPALYVRRAFGWLARP